MTPSPLWKPIQSILNLKADGLPGPLTLAAACAHPVLAASPASWAAVQRKLRVTADGIPGPQTARALLLLLQSHGTPSPATLWPTEADVPKYFGQPGEGLQLADLPYPMRLAWDTGTVVRRITCHSLVALPLQRIFSRTLEHYGMDRLSTLGLDLFGGCYKDREKVGGTTKSMHAYGIAVDLDPDRNQLKWGRSRASLAKPDYDAFWAIVESEKAVSLGRERNYDWMHFQFARLK